MENKETNSDFFLWFCQIDFNAVDVMYTVTHEKINSYKFNFGIGSSSLGQLDRGIILCSE